MTRKSSRFAPAGRRAATIGAALAIGALGTAAAGCGSDNEDVNNAIDSVQQQVSTAQGQISTALDQAKSQADEAQQQIQSVSSEAQQQADQAKKDAQNGGDYGY
jgi:hypothetical protein